MTESHAQPYPTATLFPLPEPENASGPGLWGSSANLRRWQPADVVETPDDVFRALDEEFHFTVDVCALPSNAKCERYYTPDDDGLSQDWSGEIAWCNPPYSNIDSWIAKGLEMNATAVYLLPVRSDAAWWHKYAMRSSEIRFLRGRLRFKGRSGGAPHASCIVVFRQAAGAAP